MTTPKKKGDVFGKWAWPKKRVKDLPKSPTRFAMNAFIAAAFADCFLNQNPINK
jgi:hypothetical protein